MVSEGRTPVVEERIGDLIAEQVAEGRLRATDRRRRPRSRRPTSRSSASARPRRRPATSRPPTSSRSPTRSAPRSARARGDRYTVVFRSTMLPTTCDGVILPRLEAASGLRAGRDFGVAVNPEFLREGSSVRDFFDPPKTVIGQVDDASGDAVAALYEGLPGPVYRVPIRRRGDDQVRRQRLPRAQGRLRERDRRGLQGARPRLPRRDGHLPSPTPSSTSRPAYLKPGLRVRRLVPAQGPARDHATAPAAPTAGADPREHAPLQRRADRARLPRHRGHRQAPRRRSSACPSRPAPTTCARARWSSSPSGCSAGAST